MNTNQKGAQAGRDLVGRDKVDIHNYPPPVRQSKLDKLKQQLRSEVADGVCTQEVIERLQAFRARIPEDGIIGLEAKLEKAGRSSQVATALEMKEQFAKLLARWSLYASAQEILADLLSRAEYKYTHQIHPLSDQISAVAVDELIDEKIITPAIEDLGVDILSLDHKTAMGMIYWLAERCLVRWHQ